MVCLSVRPAIRPSVCHTIVPRGLWSNSGPTTVEPWQFEPRFDRVGPDAPWRKQRDEAVCSGHTVVDRGVARIYVWGTNLQAVWRTEVPQRSPRTEPRWGSGGEDPRSHRQNLKTEVTVGTTTTHHFLLSDILHLLLK